MSSPTALRQAEQREQVQRGQSLRLRSLRDNAGGGEGKTWGDRKYDYTTHSGNSSGMSGFSNDEYRAGGSFGCGGPFGSNFPNASSDEDRGSPDDYVDDDTHRPHKNTYAKMPSTGQGDRSDDFSNLTLKERLLGRVRLNDRSQSQRPTASSRTSCYCASRYRNPTVVYDVHVTLKEVYHGCAKKVRIPRTVMTPDDRVPTVEEKEFTIDVKPGCKAGTKIAFYREGEQLYETVPGDVIFIIRDQPHPYFERDGADIRYVAKIPFRKALRGGTLEVPTVAYGNIAVPLTGIVTPTTVMRIQGQGLPHSKDPTTRGDLLMSFDIEYPRLVTEVESEAFWWSLSRLI